MISHELMISFLLILAASWLFGQLFSRLGLPMMIGQLVAGLVLGPPLLGWVTSTPSLELLAEFGIFFVMFHTGMEMDPKELKEHIIPSILAALGGFVLPFLLGFLVAYAFGGTVFQSLFVGLGISITAIAVQAVILKSMRINRSELGHIIIGAAIVDDILALIGMSVLIGLARSGSISVVEILWVLFKVGAFFGLTILVGEFIMPRVTRRVTDEAGTGFTFAMVVAVSMAYLAELAGLHLIIGAFLGGQFVRREMMDEKIYEAIEDRFFSISYGFLVPIFFVSLSFHLHINWSWSFLWLSLAITVIAILGKLLGAGLPVRLFGHSGREAMIVGFGMNGRGAVELVVATVVLNVSRELMAAGKITAPLLTEDQFAALILMAFITTVMAPVTLKWAIMRACRPEEGAAFCKMMEEKPPR